MKKLLLYLMVFFTAISVNAKCDWSKVDVKQITQFRSYYKYYAKGLESDTCTEFFWMFTYRNSKGQLSTDTFANNQNIAEFEINLKGEFKLQLRAIDKCDKCDTTWSFYLYQATFQNANWGYGMKDCKRHIFEANKLKNQPDSCVQVYWYIYDNSGNEIHTDSGYRIDYTFPWEGKFEVYCQWWNKCLNQDTFWGRNFDIYCDSTTMGTTEFDKNYQSLILSNPIKLYPNPFSKGFTFKFNGPESEYVIYTSTGQVVQMGIINKETYINTEYWDNGVYIIKVGDKQQIILLRR